jgi:hypothetical protein
MSVPKHTTPSELITFEVSPGNKNDNPEHKFLLEKFPHFALFHLVLCFGGITSYER